MFEHPVRRLAADGKELPSCKRFIFGLNIEQLELEPDVSRLSQRLEERLQRLSESLRTAVLAARPWLQSFGVDHALDDGQRLILKSLSGVLRHQWSARIVFREQWL